MKRPARYYIAWYNGKKHMEDIRKNNPMPYATAKWTIQQLRSTTHKTGELIPIRAN
jgi:hypothetical protein